ncbi:hypothetical protein D9758_005717 [Tetrapyrgos nigripes]|uniref:S-adenosyl-L-methionine-dependent methyltransferase n=1 Tax=Tetrapyrgos nigripes TaxID=182062 RepID=A0A8H5GK11_9AGAR|nr:hypothetical protein D9758_005717 [Tetrapyrgos nigripes]
MKQVDPKEIAKLCLHLENHYKTQLQSTEHRWAIVSQWDIPEDSRVLELGCGQGDCTAVLADLVGPNGHVTAVDPGAPDYGGPFTLGQAQVHLSSGPLGESISWKRAFPIEFLNSDESGEYDIAVLVLCTWYFSTPSILTETLSALNKKAKRILIAEWDLSSGKPSTNAHVLAVLTQAALEVRKEETVSNVRTLFTPSTIEAAASEAGLKLEKASVLDTADDVLDGYWEVLAVKDEGFVKQIEKFVQNERERYLVKSMREALLGALKDVGGPKNVKSMGVWCGSFVRAQ